MAQSMNMTAALTCDRQTVREDESFYCLYHLNQFQQEPNRRA